MKLVIIPFLIFISYTSKSQISNRFEYPDTLWIYGAAMDSEYGKTSKSPIKIGGGILPKNIYRYLNSLTNGDGEAISYKRIGSCCKEELNRDKPLTKFSINTGKNSLNLYFDQYEWDYPKLIQNFNWQENRKGYYGEFKQDSIFHGYGLYFFDGGGYYKGNWKNGIMDGTGEMFIPGQEQYAGEFKNGEYHGFGILKYVDGGKYEGNWSNGMRQGRGKIYYPPGGEIEFIEGNFINNEPVGKFTIYKNDKTQEIHEF